MRELTEVGRLFRAKLQQLREQERQPRRSPRYREAAVRLQTIQQSPGDHDLLSLGDVARLLNVNPRTVARWTDEGLRSFRTMGGHRRYRWGDVTAWIGRAGV